MGTKLTGFVLLGCLSACSVVYAGPQETAQPSSAGSSLADSSVGGTSSTVATLTRDWSDASLDLSSPTSANVSFATLPAALDPSDPLDPSAETHPMIPLPPAAWAGLITLSGIAWHTIRQQGRHHVRTNRR